MGMLEGHFEDGFVATNLEWAINWARESSLWPMTFALAFCATEMRATGAPRSGLDRLGAGAVRATRGRPGGDVARANAVTGLLAGGASSGHVARYLHRVESDEMHHPELAAEDLTPLLSALRAINLDG